MNLIKIAKKLSRLFINQKNSTDVLVELNLNKLHRGFFSVVKPFDGIKLAFLINGINKGLNIDNLLVEIENNIASFTIVSFGDDPSEGSCSNCGGNETITCDDCDGNGYLIDDEDNEDECDTCHGGGYLLCDDCDGNGTSTDENSTDYSIRTYVTFDSKVVEDVELLDSDVNQINDGALKLSSNSPKLIYLGIEERSGEGIGIDKDYWGHTYINKIDYENNPDTYFRSNSITINREISNLSNTFRG